MQKTLTDSFFSVRAQKPIYFQTFWNIVKSKAKKKHEINYPNCLTNIVFIKILLTPINLTDKKQVTDPNLRDRGSFFILPNQYKHTEKNIKNLFKMFSSEIEQLLVISKSQFSSKH